MRRGTATRFSQSVRWLRQSIEAARRGLRSRRIVSAETQKCERTRAGLDVGVAVVAAQVLHEDVVQAIDALVRGSLLRDELPQHRRDDAHAVGDVLGLLLQLVQAVRIDNDDIGGVVKAYAGDSAYGIPVKAWTFPSRRPSTGPDVVCTRGVARMFVCGSFRPVNSSRASG
jgi:hypothetical protein